MAFIWLEFGCAKYQLYLPLKWKGLLLSDKDSELLVLLHLKRRGHLYMHFRHSLPPCHLGPAQLRHVSLQIATETRIV
jgi:hypothetical protein